MSVASPTPAASTRKGVVIRDDRGREVLLYFPADLEKPSGKNKLRPEQRAHVAEPDSTEFWIIETNFQHLVWISSGVILFNLALRYVFGRYLPTNLYEVLKFITWPVGFLVMYEVVRMLLKHHPRQRHRQRLRSAYLAATLCPACARPLIDVPEADGCTVCSASECRAAWKLAPGANPFAFAHPLHCPKCDYDRAGVTPFTPCPECGLTLEREKLFLVRPAYPAGKGPSALHKDAIPPPGLVGINLERYLCGQCPYCGYDRTGLSPSDRCPECASTIARRAPRLEEPPPPGTRPICARCKYDMRGRERGRICPDCGIMGGLDWVPDENPPVTTTTRDRLNAGKALGR